MTDPDLGTRIVNSFPRSEYMKFVLYHEAAISVDLFTHIFYPPLRRKEPDPEGSPRQSSNPIELDTQLPPLSKPATDRMSVDSPLKSFSPKRTQS